MKAKKKNRDLDIAVAGIRLAMHELKDGCGGIHVLHILSETLKRVVPPVHCEACSRIANRIIQHYPPPCEGGKNDD